jgi:hypothetical protein
MLLLTNIPYHFIAAGIEQNGKEEEDEPTGVTKTKTPKKRRMTAEGYASFSHMMLLISIALIPLRIKDGGSRTLLG